MCRLLYVCDCAPAGASSTGVVTAAAWLLRLAWRVATALVTAALIVAVWVTPRVWRLAVRAVRAAVRQWRALHVPEAAPAPATHRREIEAAPVITWSELGRKQEANR